MTGTQNVRLINVPANTGAFVLIRASMSCRTALFIEDGSANGGIGQGFQYFIVNPFSPTDVQNQPAAFDTILPATEPVILGNTFSGQDPNGDALGQGPQDAPGCGIPPFLGTPLIWVRSNTASPIVLRVTENS